jgi:TatD DNase family protein
MEETVLDPPTGSCPPLVDTHAHLETDAFEEDREAVLARAWECGLVALVAVGSGESIESNEKTVRLADEERRIFSTVGIHPHCAKDADPRWISSLEGLLRNPKVVAVGEIGLDYHYLHSPKESQRTLFRELLSLAREAGKPVVIHDRQAHEDLRDILATDGKGIVGGVVHCFSGDYRLASWCLDRGLYLSFTGVVTFPGAQRERDVVRRIPLERILIETDAPYLTPVPHRGKRNEPAYVIYVAREIARIRGTSLEEVAAVTTENAKKLFHLPL